MNLRGQKYIVTNLKGWESIEIENSKVNFNYQAISIDFTNYYVIKDDDHMISIIQTDLGKLVYQKNFKYCIKNMKLSNDRKFIWV